MGTRVQLTSVESPDGLVLLLDGLIKLLHLCLLFFSLIKSVEIFVLRLP